MAFCTGDDDFLFMSILRQNRKCTLVKFGRSLEKGWQSIFTHHNLNKIRQVDMALLANERARDAAKSHAEAITTLGVAKAIER